MSSRSVAFARGTTSACPLVTGLMSMNAIARSLRAIVVDETAPATIPQKMQSGSAFTSATVRAQSHS